MEIYYVDILLAVITIALSKASWKLLPQYSKLEPKEWAEYLKSSKAPKMLWPAQQLIGEKDVLNGANATSFAKEIKIWRMLGNGHLNL